MPEFFPKCRTPTFKAPSPALLVIDMQNDFVRVGAPLEVPQARETIEPIKSLLMRFRMLSLPIVHTRFISTADNYFFNTWSPECADEAHRCCRSGHYRRYQGFESELPCWDIIDELKPIDGELLIDKYSYGAFHGTDLHSQLQHMGVKSVIVTGTVTQICIEETARQAFHHGYYTTIASDCVSTHAPDLQVATLKNFAQKFGWVRSAHEIAFSI